MTGMGASDLARCLGGVAGRLWIAAVLGGGLSLLPAPPAAAQQGAGVAPAAAPARPPLLLNLTRPAETPERALQEAVRDDARTPGAGAVPDVEVLPDGSVRIGRARISVTVNEACPEETHGVDLMPRPLPGRSRR
jgi:hypothetical protein